MVGGEDWKWESRWWEINDLVKQENGFSGRGELLGVNWWYQVSLDLMVKYSQNKEECLKNLLLDTAKSPDHLLYSTKWNDCPSIILAKEFFSRESKTEGL